MYQFAASHYNSSRHPFTMFTYLSSCTSSYDDKLKDINSPDSNDSGIQADVRNVQHVPAPNTDDLYAVVDRSKKQPAKVSCCLHA